MIDLSDKTDKIHTDFDTHEFSDISHSLRPGYTWGVYSQKPVSQVHWDSQVAKVIAALADDTIESNTAQCDDRRQNFDVRQPKFDVRPHVHDKISGMSLLVDTGASASIWPKSKSTRLHSTPPLKAVNGTTIATFGQISKAIHVQNSVYRHTFILADVQTPILGWDFLTTFKLDLKWQGNNCVLIDNRAKIRAKLSLEGVQPHLLGLIATTTDPLQAIPATYRALIEKYPQILTPTFQQTPTHGIEHHIDTGNSSPCHAKVRPLMPGSPKEQKGKAAWKELEKLGVIERVNPKDSNIWTSALHLVQKPDGTMRATGDYRPLNDRTQLCGYPLPNLKNFVGHLNGSRVFSKLDMVKAFYNIPLSEESSNKTTIVTPWGAFKYRRLAMGLRNSAQSYQRWMDHIFHDMPGVFVYIDDILVHSKNDKEHGEIMDELFRRLKQNGLSISLAKCTFAAPSVEFLGWTVNKDGIAPIRRKLENIANFPTPQKQKDLLGFLGCLNYYRKTLKSINGKSPAAVLQPLYAAGTNKTPGVKFRDVWNTHGLEDNFKEAKAMLLNAVELNHPDPSAPIALTTDASLTSIGGVLEQFVDNQWQPLGFWSRHLKPSQRKWSCFRRELYAIHQSMRHFLPEFEGRHLTVFCDHKPILGAFKSPTSMSHDPVARNQMVEIGFHTNDIRYIEGKSNCVADWLSRPPDVPLGSAHTMTDQEANETIDIPMATPLISALHFHTINPLQFAEDQDKCTEVATHLKGHHPPDIQMCQKTFLPDVKIWCDVSTGVARPMVPVSWRTHIFNTYHNLSHPGQKSTVKLVSDRYYWPNLGPQVAQWVKECKGCQEVKHTARIKPPMKPIPVTADRFSDILVDVVGPMPISEGQRYLLTIYDRTTRWITAVPMPEASAQSCVTAFTRGWIQDFGLPRSVKSDNGSTFVSNLWKNFQSALGTTVSFSPPYRAQAIGGLERQHKDIKKALKTALLRMGDAHGSRWMEALPWTLLSKHATYQPDLTAAPSDLVFGGPLRLPGDLLLKSLDAPVADLLETIRTHVAKAPVQPSHHNTQKINLPPQVHTATHVYVRDAKPSQLGPAYQGPFEIVERMGDSCLRLRVGKLVNGQDKFEVQHWSNCKPAEGNHQAAERKKRGRKPKSDVQQLSTPDVKLSTPIPTVQSTRVLRSATRNPNISYAQILTGDY